MKPNNPPTPQTKLTPFNSVDVYIQAQSLEAQGALQQVRETIRLALPEVHECIAYGIPTFKDKTNVIHFSANKHHIGVYPGDKAMLAFEERLATYARSKGAIRFPLSQALPLDLISDIARWCYASSQHKQSTTKRTLKKNKEG